MNLGEESRHHPFAALLCSLSLFSIRFSIPFQTSAEGRCYSVNMKVMGATIDSLGAFVSSCRATLKTSSLCPSLAQIFRPERSAKGREVPIWEVDLVPD